MIGTVDQCVTTQTAPPRHLRPRGARARRLGSVASSDAARRQIGPAVDLVRMVTAVTVLTQPRDARLEQRRSGRAVRGMTERAVVRDRAVFPQERPALLGVA